MDSMCGKILNIELFVIFVFNFIVTCESGILIKVNKSGIFDGKLSYLGIGIRQSGYKPKNYPYCLQ